MPLVRSQSMTPCHDIEPVMTDLEAELRHADAGRRLAAVRAAVRAGRVDLLVETIRETHDPGLREAALTGFARLGGSAGIVGLIEHLRGEDVMLRNAVIETLQGMGSTIVPAIAPLVRDPDADVRIFALNILQAIAGADAVALALDVLAREGEINVCAAAVEVLAEAGDPGCVPALNAALERFPDQPFFTFAVRTALRRIG